MQKKILLSLLATAPVAITVSAHENASLDNVLRVYEGSKWVFGGIGNVKFDNNTATVPQPATTASLNVVDAWNNEFVPDLPKGTYRIDFGTLSNAVIKVNGEAIDSDDNLFEYKGDGKFVITIEGIQTGHQFTFGQGKLTLIYDFKTEQTNLSDQLNAIAPTELTEQPVEPSQAYTDLTAEKAELQKRIDAIAEEIAAINLKGTDPAGTDDYYLQQYVDNRLFEDPNKIQKEINDLLTDVKAYNEKAAAENQRYDNQLTNQGNFATLSGLFDKFKEDYDKLKEAIKGSSDFVQKTCEDDTVALDAKVEAFNNALQAAFFNGETIKDDAKVDTKDLEKAFAELNTDLTALNDKYNTAVADQKAYNEWWNAREAMLKKQAEVNAALAAAAKENSIYKDVADANTEEAQAIVDTANEAFTIKEQEVEGASAKKEHDLGVANQAIEDLDALLGAFNDLVATQDAAKAAADAAIKEVQDALNEAIESITDAAEADKAGLNEKAAAIQDMIDAEQAKIDAEYGKHDLTEDDYSTEEIKNAIKELNDEIAASKHHKAVADANQAYIDDLQKALDELKKQIDETFADTPLDGKFDSTIENIQNSINEFTGRVNEFSKEDKYVEFSPTLMGIHDTIAGNIETTGKIAQEVKDKYDACSEIIAGWQDGLDAFQKAYDDKQVVTDKDGKALVDKAAILGDAIKNLQTSIDGYDKAFEALPDQNNQALKEAIESLLAELTEAKEEFAGEIAAAQQKFEEDVTAANRKVDADLLSDIKTGFDAIEEGAFPGKQEMTEALAEMDELMAAIPDMTPLAKQDSEYQEAWNKLYDLQQQLQKIVDNIAAYKAIMDAYETAKSNLNAAKEGVQNKATEPALTYYMEILNGLDTKLESLKDRADEDYNNFASVADESGVKERMEGIGEIAIRTETACDHNEAYHNAQLKEIEGAQKAIDDAIEYINTKDQIPGDKDKYLDRVAEQQEALEQLKNDVAASFAVGMSEANDPDLDKAYNDIIDAVKQILSDLDTNYKKDVTEYNEDLYKDLTSDGKTFLGWYDYLIDSYRKSVDSYDEYNESSKLNAGYKDAISNVITTHESIYSYSTPIRQLRDDVRAAITKMNEESVVLTEEWMNENAFTPASNIYNEMVAEVIDMQTKANAVAENYYTDRSAEANEVIENAVKTLTDAGVSEKNAEAAVKNLRDIMAKVAVDYTTGKEAPNIIGLEKDKLSVSMGKTIADQLDKVIDAKIDFNAEALKQWNEDYSGAVETIDGYLKKLDDYKSLSKAQKEAYTDALNEIKDQATALDTEAKASEDILGDLKDLQERLDDLLKQAEELDTQAKADSDNNLAEKQAYDGFIADLNGLDSDLDALKAWVEGMAIEHAQNFGTIEAAIEAARQAVEEESGELTTGNNSSIIQGKIDNIKTLIENAYESAYDAEKVTLKDLLDQAKRLYNEYAAGDNFDQATAVEINAHIDRLQGVINALPADITDRKNQRDDVLRYQGELCDVIQQLGGLQKDPTDPAAGILAELNAQYQTVSDAIDAMNELLSGCDESVASQFEKKAEEQGQALSDVKDAYTAAGANVIATADNYKADMTEIADAVKKLTEEIQTAKQAWEEEQAAHQVSNDRADVLQGELNDLKEQFEAYKEFTLGSDFYKANAEALADVYENYFDIISGNIAVLQRQLDELKKEYAFTENSPLPGFDFVQDQVETVSRDIAEAESNYQINKASEALSQASNIVWAGSHINQSKLEETLEQLGKSFAAMQTAYTIPDAEELREAVKQFIADCEALSAEAVENAFTYGDVNGDGEVNLTDLSEALDLILENQPFDPNSKPMRAADMNKDGRLSIADALAIVKRVFGDDENTVRRAMMLNRSNAADGNNLIAAIPAGNEGATRFIDIDLTNATAFVGGQFDLVIPAGMEVVDIETAARAQGMSLTYRVLSDGSLRVIVLSTELNEFSGNEGAIVRLSVTGRGDVKINNALFGDSNAVEHEVKSAGTSAIESIYDSVKNGVKRVYDAAGRLMHRDSRGISIEVDENGKATKTYRK